MSPLVIVTESIALESNEPKPQPTMDPAILNQDNSSVHIPPQDDDDSDTIIPDCISDSDDDSIYSVIELPTEGYPRTTIIPATEPNPNLVIDADFTKQPDRGAISPWKSVQLLDTGTYSKHKHISTKALKIVPRATSDTFGHISMTQLIEVDPNATYTLSSDIKTEQLRHGFAYLNMEQLTSERCQAPDHKWRNNHYS